MEVKDVANQKVWEFGKKKPGINGKAYYFRLPDYLVGKVDRVVEQRQKQDWRNPRNHSRSVVIREVVEKFVNGYRSQADAVEFLEGWLRLKETEVWTSYSLWFAPEMVGKLTQMADDLGYKPNEVITGLLAYEFDRLVD